MTPVQQTRILNLLARGFEVAPEFSEHMKVSVESVVGWLEELHGAGLVSRESKPTYQTRAKASRVYFRYRVKGRVAA